MARRRKAPARPVLVYWDDAQTEDGWESTKSLTPSQTRSVASIGWIIKDEPTYLLLAADKGVADDDTNRRLTIPKAWINKITHL